VGDFLDDVPAGSVVVIDNAGRTDCTVWGGIMTRVAAHRAVAATVINGVCRDTEVSSSAGYPIWSAGRFMRTGKDRVRLRSLQEPVVIDGVTIRAGDVVCCDEDGVVVVPAEHVAEVGRIAEHIDQVEASIVEAVLGGSSLAEARAAQGYHVLQTPSASSGGAA
jgi:regulator of RNase E activity RraA